MGPARLNPLLDSGHSPEALLAEPPAGLDARARQGLREAAALAPDADLEWLAQPGHHLITRADPRYPERLKPIADAPIALYVAGDPGLLDQPQIAIVGSRNPTPGGERNAFEFARHLAGCGLVITSGLALGIDGAAHRGALAAEAPTIAVTATGLDLVYPARHRSLAHQIAEHGALISEFPIGTRVRAGLFPRRNRIISGLALGVLVVEAALGSGSLITARLAGEQGREVFAIPGSIHNPLARGCHQLIREGARLVESAHDLFEELAPQLQACLKPSAAAPQAPATEPAPTSADDEYGHLLEAMGHDPVSADELVARTGLAPEAVSSMLLLLELEGRVSPVPGGRFVRQPPPAS